MAKNPFGKSRDKDQPYAIYTSPGMNFEWRVLKTYQTRDGETKNSYARWLIAAKSDATYGSLEMGDTYCAEVLQYGQLVACDDAWAEAYGKRPRQSVKDYLAG